MRVQEAGLKFEGSEIEGATGSALSQVAAADAVSETGPRPPSVKNIPPARPERIQVDGSTEQTRITKKVEPVYPLLARQARIQGVVKLSSVINKDGKVQRLEVIHGHPLLVPSALAAVKQWEYDPTLLNNEAVEIVTQIDVTFKLQE